MAVSAGILIGSVGQSHLQVQTENFGTFARDHLSLLLKRKPPKTEQSYNLTVYKYSGVFPIESPPPPQHLLLHQQQQQQLDDRDDGPTGVPVQGWGTTT